MRVARVGGEQSQLSPEQEDGYEPAGDGLVLSRRGQERGAVDEAEVSAGCIQEWCQHGLFAGPTHATTADGDSETEAHAQEEPAAGGVYQPLLQDDVEDLPSSGQPLHLVVVVSISGAEEGAERTKLCARVRHSVLMERDTREAAEVVSLQEGPLESQCLQTKNV